MSTTKGKVASCYNLLRLLGKKCIVVLNISKLLLYILVCKTARLLPSGKRDLERPGSSWIIGENYGNCIFDNGFCFYEYCLSEKGRHDVYFVVSSSCLGDPRIPAGLTGNLLVYGSYAHVKILLSSNAYFFSHSPRDLIYPLLHKWIFRNRYIVYLKHGIFALKRATPDQLDFSKFLDVFVVSSQWERDIIKENFNIPEEKIRITGLARYDRLGNRAPEECGAREILYIPTWRFWTREYSSHPPYTHGIMKFLDSRELEECLSSNRAVLSVWFHKSMADQCSWISGRIRSGQIRFVQDGERTVQDLIEQAHVMITDYSSVCWDFSYLEKPVIFFQFDRDQFLERFGSYIDLAAPEMGFNCTNHLDTVDCLERILAERELIVNSSIGMPFEYRDRMNCDRIYKLADNRNAT